MSIRAIVSMEVVADESPDVSFLEPDSARYDDVTDADERAKYQAEDASRLEAFNAGDWYMTGIRAKAELHIPHGQDFITTVIRTPGLWGVESDCSDDYRLEVFSEEMHTLRAMLAEFANGVEIEEA